MAFTGIFWDSDQGGGSDIHVLRGQTSRSLADFLQLGFDTGDPVPASKAPLPADVTSVVFTPISNFTLAAHGISVHAGTGVVTTAALAAGAVSVPNFIVQATVTHTSTAAPNPLPPIPIRIHVHNAVTKVTLSPDPLTVRVGSNETSFTYLADFDDGTVGDISWHPGVTWQPAAGVDLTVGADGTLIAAHPGKNIQVTATMPADMGGAAWSATVITDVPWGVLTAKLVPGSPGSARPDLPNLLFLSDGFLAGEQGRFEALVTAMVNDLAAAQTTFPFSLLRPNVNFWTLFLPSRERGATPLNGLRYVVRAAGRLSMKPVPIPLPPDLVHGIQSVENLLWQVGLPIPADRNVPLATKQQAWSVVYGAAHTNGVTPAIYQQWTDLADHTLALERDTVFGLAMGARPQVQAFDDGRSLHVHPFRAGRPDIDVMLSGLQAADQGMPIPMGPTWSVGKDSGMVMVLSAGARRSGQEGDVIASNLVNHSEIKATPVAGSHLLAVVPYDVPAKSSFFLRAVVAHEVGHALNLGDEYGLDRPKLSATATLAARWNLQTDSSARNALHLLDGTKIQWRWPRMLKTAVLVKPPEGPQSGGYLFTVGVGQGAGFTALDIVRLRPRALVGFLGPSSAFEVVNASSTAAGDVIEAKLGPGEPPILNAAWPAGSLLYLPRLHPTTGHELTLLDERVQSWTTGTGMPLNRQVLACARDKRAVQPAVNKPPALPAGQPKYSAWIIGLDDGGAGADCGVFHPSGACIMRHLQVSAAAVENPDVPYLFCGVCRYILADTLDPTIHPAVEADFQKLFSLT